ncbi:MAG: hypothetical protein UT24_C0018G0005 [Candidatus Woesebacteria bacterium GW2011_GWB1_39_12]|uniref:Uncharacterized protein n=1 Tax=Candidatus Woesebacteria bacterium GW2011_GWB1_39_12 TaxID=1618574 RepID=A0A0G0M9U1_9BACT|nr:MAG: hypothetical protein UT24_C0018G0005 [Candidatus Woesebacteria bacterium GW2011_GWB1_39_12]
MKDDPNQFSKFIPERSIKSASGKPLDILWDLQVSLNDRLRHSGECTLEQIPPYDSDSKIYLLSLSVEEWTSQWLTFNLPESDYKDYPVQIEHFGQKLDCKDKDEFCQTLSGLIEKDSGKLLQKYIDLASYFNNKEKQ